MAIIIPLVTATRKAVITLTKLITVIAIIIVVIVKITAVASSPQDRYKITEKILVITILATIAVVLVIVSYAAVEAKIESDEKYGY